MSGKISGVDSSNPPPAGAASAGQRPAVLASGSAAGAGATSGAGTGSGTGAAGEVIRITDTANQLVNVEQTLSAVPVVNQQRVAQLSTAIQQGTYPVQPERIANQLLQFEQLLPEDSAD